MNTLIWSYYVGLYRGRYRRLALSVLFSVAQSLLVVPIAWLVRFTFDRAIPANDIRLIVGAGLSIVGLHLVYNAAGLLANYHTTHLTRAVTVKLRAGLLETVYALPRAFYGGADWGRLHALLVHDTERLDRMSEALVAQLVPAAIVSLVLAGVLLYLNAVLFLVMAVLAPLVLLVGRASSRRVRALVRRYQTDFRAYSRSIMSALNLMELTRVQAAEAHELAQQQATVTTLGRSSQELAWRRTLHTTLPAALIVLIGVVILILGGAAVARGAMTVGQLLAFYAAVALLSQHAQTITLTLSPIIDGLESLATLHSLQAQPSPPPYTGTRQIDFHGRVALAGVSFQYKDAPILTDISLSLELGTLTSISGPNGSGKSTLIYLVLGLYRPDAGRLLADGVPYGELDVSHLRRQIGVVLQEPILFPGTVYENITYGAPQATREQVLRAAHLATAHSAIESLPQGYETLVGEKGMLLSGGQRQRIAIARALLRQPRLLILDEPTNHLDAASARQLIANLRGSPTRPATLVVTHHNELVHLADQSFYLQDGQLAPLAGQLLQPIADEAPA